MRVCMITYIHVYAYTLTHTQAHENKHICKHAHTYAHTQSSSDESEMAQKVKARMDSITKIEKLKREWNEDEEGVANSPGPSKKTAATKAARKTASPRDSSPPPSTPKLTRSAVAQRAYELLKADIDDETGKDSGGAGGADARADKIGVGAGRVVKRDTSIWDDDEEEESDGDGVSSVMGRGRNYVEEFEGGPAVDDEDEWADYEREYDDDAWDEKDDGATAAQVEEKVGRARQREREKYEGVKCGERADRIII